jgi:hypothetical protein
MYQALAFCNDLKLAHYIKIPPRHTFICQIVATLVNTFVAASIFNFQMSFPNVCTPEAAFRFVCPGQTTFFTGAVFWGTLGPKHLFGAGKRYNLLLLGFPVGVMIPIGMSSPPKHGRLFYTLGLLLTDSNLPSSPRIPKEGMAPTTPSCHDRRRTE